MKKLSAIGEFGLIGLLRKQFSGSRRRGRPEVIKGIGDDTAVLPFHKDKYLLFTTDMIVEGVHFTKKSPPEAIGRKAMACNLSDIAAMGGVPTYAVVSLGTPARVKVKFIQEIYAGMEHLGKKYRVTIVGGDTVRSDKLIINIALLGEVKRKALTTRAGAKRGDWIFVTGPLGNSLKSGRHLSFTPRLKEAQYLVQNFKPTAMLDISDGLAADVGHILEESRVGAVLYEPKIPCHRGAALNNALYDGEDFELLFTVPPASGKKLLADKRFYFIGEIVDRKNGLTLVDRRWKSRRLPFKGFTH
ncbi:MAG: hypothetical protein A2787_08750, partial [Omnitrophica WOR_2 bacterium RIFCSPHIGHO2_01_FULL_48_9]